MRYLKLSPAVISIFVMALLILLLVYFLLSGTGINDRVLSSGQNELQVPAIEPPDPPAVILSSALLNSSLPTDIFTGVQWHINNNSGFITEVFNILQEDQYLWALVDKRHSMSPDYEPHDLVPLESGSYETAKTTMMLRKPAADSLEEMAAAAKTEGLILLVSSAYRAYLYQAFVYKDNVIRLGQEAADMLSARPGTSQHQLGLAIDFGSIDDDFAETDEGIWLVKNASRFGWSLSYPYGYEDYTGYQWESWHYRYVGKQLASFINTYFNGIQQFALRFFFEYLQETTN